MWGPNDPWTVKHFGYQMFPTNTTVNKNVKMNDLGLGDRKKKNISSVHKLESQWKVFAMIDKWACMLPERMIGRKPLKLKP